MRLFGKSYDAMCHRIRRLGGNYERVTADVLHRTIAQLATIVSVRSYRRTLRQPLFNSWRRGKQGAWVVVALSPYGSSAGHCIVLRDGQALDNGWAMEWPGRAQQLRVQAAWELQL